MARHRLMGSRHCWVTVVHSSKPLEANRLWSNPERQVGGVSVQPCCSWPCWPCRLVCTQHHGVLQVQVALAVAAQQQQQHAHSNGGHHGSVAMPASAALHAGQGSGVTAASVRFCQQCGQAHGSRDFPPDAQQADGMSRLCRHCLTCVPCLSLSPCKPAATPSFRCRDCACVPSAGRHEEVIPALLLFAHRAGMLGELRPAAGKYCGSCYETKPLADFTGSGEYCRCAAAAAPAANDGHVSATLCSWARALIATDRSREAPHCRLA